MTPESNFYIFWTNTVWLKGFSLSPTQPNQTLKKIFWCFWGLVKISTLPIKLTLPLKALPVLQPPLSSTAPFARGLQCRCAFEVSRKRKEMTLSYTQVIIFTGFSASNPEMTTKEKYSQHKFHPGKC